MTYRSTTRVPRKLVVARKRQRVSMEVLAARTGLTYHRYRRIEHGQAIPTDIEAAKIARAVGEPVEALFEQVEFPRTPLAAAIRDADLRQHQVAAMLGVDSTLVSRYTSGVRFPPLARALAIAELLDRDPAEIFPGLFACHDPYEARPHTVAAAALDEADDG